MHLAVISHKVCWPSADSPTGYVTDGGFPLQMEAISELFSSTELTVPCELGSGVEGTSPISGKNVKVTPLSVPTGKGIRRKIHMLNWVVLNGPTIWRSVRSADAVHTPIPGDVGTIGMIFALILRKRLFVRHCGNWLMPRTVAERLWKWCMVRFAGPRNVMLATGGSNDPPSEKNPNVQWIFSTSLRKEQIMTNVERTPPSDGTLRLIIVCRQEARKGTDIVIAALPSIASAFCNVTLDVVGGGSLLEKLKQQAESLGVADRVTFHGKVQQAKVVTLLQKAQVFCYPTSASEGFPKVVLEALASGMPVLTTRVSVLPDLISSGCGVLLDSPSAASLSKAVIEICSDLPRYKVMSSTAINTAKKYSLENWRDFIGKTLRESWNVSALS